MKRLLVSLPMLFVATAASADMTNYSANMKRNDISNMTCAEVQSELRSGSRVLSWHSKSGMPRWGKYMSENSSCKMQQMKVRASVATSDTKSCRVYQCSQYGRSPYR